MKKALPEREPEEHDEELAYSACDRGICDRLLIANETATSCICRTSRQSCGQLQGIIVQAVRPQVQYGHLRAPQVLLDHVASLVTVKPGLH